MLMRTTSPGDRVNCVPGTMPVPVSSTAPAGNRSAETSQRARSASPRCIWPVLVSPRNTMPPPRPISRLMENGGSTEAAGTMQGPSAQLPS